ncbi:vibriobactin synthetase [Azorhizobium oxalatiphilum]|uniref:Vibriobactin synthetase n=1 Tax=Azorhizobium oxalatiphilum TaxID=980631 RepID=A0A917BNM3_9HYPH|nr:condensation domain-containing protein [Azorhizobium oxalatiphilum]GGF50176.1 vibriobactin synthetase [Azorhizobium oxalatiphilum]
MADPHASGWMPLTLPQLDFWEEYVLQPDQPLSTVAHYLDLAGDVDGAALRAAVTKAVGESDVLGIRFRLPPGGTTPEQACDPERIPLVKMLDVRGEEDPVAAAHALMRADVEAPLDLLTDPLSVTWLLRVENKRYFWYLRAHHIVLDGFGISLIEQRCAHIYGHLVGGADAGPPFHRFESFIAEEAAYGASPRHGADSAYWRDYLAPATRLPVVHKDDEGYRSSGLEHEEALPEAFCAALRKASSRTGIGWPDLLVILSGAYLSHHLGRTRSPDDGPLTLWLPFMSRWGSVGAHMPAMLVNILPLHVDVAAQETLGGYLTRMAGVLRKQRSHGRYRIEQMAADHGIGRGARYLFSPLVNVLPFNPAVFAGCEATRHVLANGPGDGFEVTFRGRDDASGLTLNLDADPALVPPEAFHGHARDLPAFILRALTEMDLGRALSTLHPDAVRAGGGAGDKVRSRMLSVEAAEDRHAHELVSSGPPMPQNARHARA